MTTEDRFGLSSKNIDTIKALFSKNPKIEKAILYGSRAKGNFKTGSDIDLVLVGPDLTTDDLLALKVAFYESSIPHQVDLSLIHQIENSSLLEHIQRMGEVIYP